MDWLTTYLFPVFGHGWEEAIPETWPHRGDLVVRNDFCIGYGESILPGITIGNGAIILSRTVVTMDVPPCASVGGNPTRYLHMCFEASYIDRLDKIAC